MSFSSDVKEELSMQMSHARHCQIAELSALISLCGKVAISADDQYSISIQTENIGVARKSFTLLKKIFKIKAEIAIRQNVYFKKHRSYFVKVTKHEEAIQVLKTTKLLNRHLEIEEELTVADNLVVRNTCCKRAFIRGAFLASGSISDPERSYHFEIVCATLQKANQIKDILHTFGLEGKIIDRKNRYIVYLKEAETIVDILNIMEAHVALMNLENIRILKDMRNSVNRQVNCETANINKTVNAAVKQIEDIKFIEEKVGLDFLSEPLQEIARIRLQHPEVPLKELGTFMSPPMGKSGVNHRLRKIGQVAEELRVNQGGVLL